MRKHSVGFLGLAALAFAAVPWALGQDFDRSYGLEPGSRISISSASGDIRVQGYDGGTIQVRAYKEGPDRHLVEVEDLSTGDAVVLKSRYPQNCNCNATVRFEVQVPRRWSYNFESLSTASGNISATDVTGDLRAKSASGDVTAAGVNGSVDASTASGDVTLRDVIGRASAKSASGDVVVQIARLEGEGSMTFSTASGDVSVRMPPSLDAEVTLSTASGDLETDFPLTVEERREGKGRKAYGRLGAGTRPMKISSASGDVSLKIY